MSSCTMHHGEFPTRSDPEATEGGVVKIDPFCVSEYSLPSKTECSSVGFLGR